MTKPVYPEWLKLTAAFMCGALVASVALVRYVPRESTITAGQGTQGYLEVIGDLPNDLPGDFEEFVGEDGRTVRRVATGPGGEGPGGEGPGGEGPGGEGPGGEGPGGEQERGVYPDRIRLASTVVQDGEAASLLKPAIAGMEAVINRVNRQGGIHGRRLELDKNNDSFDAGRGQQLIKNYIEGDYFALPVVPSAEGLGAAILAKDIQRAGIPVVGTDGMRQEQYGDPWVWPVATATVSTMRIMADYGFKEKGARTFAIVYDSKYRFGLEGRHAFADQVKQLGGTLVTSVGLDPDNKKYGGAAAEFNRVCGESKCDMVALLLLPDTAKLWLATGAAMGGKYRAGAQTLFTDGFAQACAEERSKVSHGNDCNGFSVWTGYNPPIGTLNTGGVAQYAQEVEQLGADPLNQFVQGAYLGMSVFVEALQRVGPNLTRARLQEVMNSMEYKSDLSASLRWSASNKWANTQARAFEMNVVHQRFQGWGQGSGFRKDPSR